MICSHREDGIIMKHNIWLVSTHTSHTKKWDKTCKINALAA